MGNAARDAGVVARRIHLVVVIDRLLTRLLTGAPGRWVVKGGYANQLRRADDGRRRLLGSLVPAARVRWAPWSDLGTCHAGMDAAAMTAGLPRRGSVAHRCRTWPTRLRFALEDTCARRASHGLPVTMPRASADWRVAFGRIARDIGLDPDIVVGHATAAGMLEPILAGEVPSATWAAAGGRWKP